MPPFSASASRKRFSPRKARRGTRRSGSRSGSRSAAPAAAPAAHAHTPIKMSLRTGKTYTANIKRHLGKRR